VLRFICWVRFGHVWNELGSMRDSFKMYQCVFCGLTRCFHTTRIGKVR
jgi:hypothetical protein